MIVKAELPLLDRATSTVGDVVPTQTIHEIPLNGRHFVDLGPLVAGSVTPSQTGFSTTPIRGTGALAFNTAGNREEAVGYVVNGVTTNNLTFGSISFPPPVASIAEFKVDNSTFSPEHGSGSWPDGSSMRRRPRVRASLKTCTTTSASGSRSYRWRSTV